MADGPWQDRLRDAAETVPLPPKANTVADDSGALDTDALQNAKEVKLPPGPSVTELQPIIKVGVDLAKIVLWFIAGATLLLLALIGLEEFGRNDSSYALVEKVLSGIAAKPPSLSDNGQVENFQKSIDATKSLLATLGAARQDTRDFMMKVCQLILISILLPILTALLGYIFGTQQSGLAKKNSDEGNG